MTTPCINPQEIHEGDLLAYVWGEARPEVAAHVARCAFCTAEVATLRLLEAAFQFARPRAGCPDTDVLLQFHMELLPPSQQRQVQAHVATCLDCQAEMRRFLPHSASPSWLERLRQAGKSVLEAVRIPPAVQPALVVRGVSSEQIYQAGSYQVVLAKEPPIAAEKRWGLEGQVIQTEAPVAVLPGQVSLWQGESLIARDVVDQFGYFGLENIVPGTYTLHIELQDSDIIINNVAIS